MRNVEGNDGWRERFVRERSTGAILSFQERASDGSRRIVPVEGAADIQIEGEFWEENGVLNVLFPGGADGVRPV